MSKEPSAAEKLIGDFAPKLVDLTDQVLFGDVWERPQLSKRDRSLATVSALIAMNRPDQLRFHLARAVEDGTRAPVDRGQTRPLLGDSGAWHEPIGTGLPSSRIAQ